MDFALQHNVVKNLITVDENTLDLQSEKSG